MLHVVAFSERLSRELACCVISTFEKPQTMVVFSIEFHTVLHPGPRLSACTLGTKVFIRPYYCHIQRILLIIKQTYRYDVFQFRGAIQGTYGIKLPDSIQL